MHFPGVPDDKRSITIEQLLTHTSGLGREAIRRTGAPDRDEGVRRILASRLRSKPGERYSYSNSGYQLLAAIAEQLDGAAFGQVLSRRVFGPAGMHASGVVTDTTWPADRIARGSNEWRELPAFTTWPRGWRPGSGDVVSRAGDLFRLHQALRDGRLLPRASLDRMQRGRVAAGDSMEYGYGWFVSLRGRDRGMIGHGGDNVGYHSEFRWYPRDERVIVLLTGQEIDDENGVGVAVQKRTIADRIARLLDGDAVPVPAARRPDAALERALEGRYEGRGGARLTVWADPGAMRLGADGQPAIDALLGAPGDDAERCARANRRAAALLEASAQGDTAALRRELGGAASFFAPAWFEDWSGWTARLGVIRGTEVLGTRRYPFGDDMWRTNARLEFERGAVDWAITWEGDEVYETLTELGTPHAAILPAAAIAADTLATLDLITHRSRRMAIRREGGRVVEIGFEGPAGREVFRRPAR
jgi:hypothetical protein